MLSAALALPGCSMWREHPVTVWGDATGGEGLERVFWKSVKAQDWTNLTPHIAGNYIYILPDATLRREATMNRLQQLRIDEYSLGDFQVELNSQTLVVTYLMTARGSSGSQPLPAGPQRMMTVWQQQKAGWMAIAHSDLGAVKTSSAGNPSTAGK
ncbi:MAG: nuclear transport factor 2 family protein [Acidobacteriales bacterium]|nr:nuclear transport factor 2 family protein [Terriglobales bacterium]